MSTPPPNPPGGPPYGPPQGNPYGSPQGAPPQGTNPYPQQPPPGGYPPNPGYPQQPPQGYPQQPPQGYPQQPPHGYAQQPPPGYQQGYPGGPPQPPKKSKLPLILTGLFALLLVGGGAFFFVKDASAGEVFLVPAASPGPDPFSDTPFAGAPDPNLAKPAVATTSPTVAPAGTAVAASSGGKPGLYGGTRNKAACDPAQMVSFLQANPAKAQAWVNALVADPSVRLPNGQPLTTANIPQYVASLTSLVLLSDTRVTNHGFKGSRANQIQSVLQKGSAVLVDTYGVPRVKCYCGNPLIPAKPTRGTPKYSGPKWPDFNPIEITIISPPPEPIKSFVVRDPETGETFEIPPGYITEVPPSAGNQPPPSVPGGIPTGNGSVVSSNPPTVDPNDCSVVDCDDDTEDYEALERAVQQEEEANERSRRQQQQANDHDALARDYGRVAASYGQENQTRGCGHGIGTDPNAHYQWALNQSKDAIAGALATYAQMMANCSP